MSNLDQTLINLINIVRVHYQETFFHNSFPRFLSTSLSTSQSWVIKTKSKLTLGAIVLGELKYQLFSDPSLIIALPCQSLNVLKLLDFSY